MHDFGADGIGVIIDFNTPEGHFFLGPYKDNPEVTDKNLKKQFTTSIGGRLTDHTLSLREAIKRSIKFKMLGAADVDKKSIDKRSVALNDNDKAILSFIDKILAGKFSQWVGVHTDQWKNTNGSINVTAQAIFKDSVRAI